MKQHVIRTREPLLGLKQALANGKVKIGVLGGSISSPSQNNSAWPDALVTWLLEKYPHVRFSVENAAAGSTGSQYALFRAQEDIIERDCDLIFIEYAVNDSIVSPEIRMRTREGLIRKIRSATKADIVIVYTFMQNMYDDMLNEQMPPSIKEFEQLAEHYGISSVWMGLHALEEVKQGRMTWAQWLPDGLHPQERGSLSYAQAVCKFLESELDNPDVQSDKNTLQLIEPLDASHWQNSFMFPFDEMKLTGPWVARRRRDMTSVNQELFTSAPGARLSFAFEGRGLTLASLFSKMSAEYRYRLDQGEWIFSNRDRSGWCPDLLGYPRLDLIADDLHAGMHSFEMEIVHGNGLHCKSTNFHLIFAGIVR